MIEQHLSTRPTSAPGYLLLGELERRMGEGTDQQERAEAAYRRAIEVAPDSAPAYRALGLLCRGQHRGPEAQRAFQRYLELAPDAPDRPIIASYVREST